MPSLTLQNRLIWFAHCPKAGGTSVERVLVDHFGDAVGHLQWGWDLWWKGGGWRQADPPNSPQHLIWQDAERILPAQPDVVFAVIRDPVARIVSEYRYQRQGRRGTRIGRLLAQMPFSLWLRVMLRVVQKNAYAFDNHLRPQTDFVPTGAQVFRLEDGLAPVVQWLAKESGRPELQGCFPHLLPSKGPKVPVDPRDQALIGVMFAIDYDRFGYARPKAGPTARPILDRMAAAFAFPVCWLERRGLV